MKKLIIIFVNVLLLSVYAQAQKKVGEFSWQGSIPTGEFKDFIEPFNAMGLNFQGRHYLANDRTSVGGSISFFYFQDKQGKRTIDAPNGGAFTGDVTNFTNIYGLQAIIQQDLKDRSEKVVPFVRAGIGGCYQDQKTWTGVYEIQNDGVQFMANGEVGIRVGDKNKGVVLAGTYHWMPAASDMVATTFFGIRLGITYSKF